MSLHIAMEHENDVSNMVGCRQVVRIYSFMSEIKLHIRTSYIVVLFVNLETNHFISIGNRRVFSVRGATRVIWKKMKTQVKLILNFTRPRAIECL